MALGPGQLLAGEHDDALTIADLYDQVEVALGRAFPRHRDVWVRGEIQHLADQHGRRGHCYLDLVDPDAHGSRQAPVLRVKCWQSTWGPLRGVLRREGIELAPGMVVVIRGTLDFYRPKAEIGFVLSELDVTALLGRLAAQRAALLRALGAEGLVERNRSLPVPAVPLRIGLVASPGSEGYRDFVGQLEGSGFGFRVRLLPTTVQGTGAPGAVASSLRKLSALGPSELDLVVIVRGGGSKADLSAFDAEPVARAVATCPVPVWTGIGHTGDESVADVVANRSCITPTECGRELAQRVGRWWEESVASTAALIARRAEEVVTRSDREHASARHRLMAMAAHRLDRQADQLAQRVDAVARCAPRVADDARGSVLARGRRLVPLSAGHLERSAERITSWRRLLTAYDVERQLERGYSLTVDNSGRVVRSVAELESGARLVTRLADGSVRCTVDSVEPVDRADPGATGSVAADGTGESAGRGVSGGMMAADDHDGTSGADGPGVDTMSYTAASEELDEIVHFFEQREVDVDQLVARLMRATAIVEELDKRLRRTRVQVEQLVPKLAAVVSDAPEPEAPGDRRDPDADGHGPDPATPRRASPSRSAAETPELF